jgi:hypothetical protein
MSMVLSIDRLSLRVPLRDKSAAGRLAELVAACLATANAPDAAMAAERVRVSLSYREGESLESMARRIASELLKAAVRTS